MPPRPLQMSATVVALQISEGFSEGMLQSGSVKPPVPPHALALYQQQITKAHESAREDLPPNKLSQPQQQQQVEKEQPPSSSPRGKSRSPAVGDKEGRRVCVSLCLSAQKRPVRAAVHSRLLSSSSV